MILNRIKLFDEPTPELLTPAIKREIVNYIDIFKTKKLNVNHHADLIGNLSGYNFIKLPNDANCGGYCNSTGKIIALRQDQGQPIATIFHELGHAMQANIGLFITDQPLSYWVKIEHQAETIAYNLYSALVDKNIDHRKFNIYFNVDDIKWLNEYYNGFYENDLF